MIRRNTQNRKMKINLHCPNCGMLLTDKKTEGFVLDAQTYCCKGCAEGTGCTCREVRLPRSKGGNRRGDIGQRNPENSPHDKNFNQEVSTSGKRLGVRHETEKAPPRFSTRGDRLADGRKAPRSQSKERPSTREPARGRSEFIKRRSHSTRVDRFSETGTKSGKSTH